MNTEQTKWLLQSSPPGRSCRPKFRVKGNRELERIGMALLLAVCVMSSTMAQEAPPGAAALGYTKCLINEHPSATNIAPGNNGNYKWFSGQWDAQPPSLDHYSTHDGVLVINQGGDLVSTPRDFSTGKLPLLPESNGFYVEFDVRLSDNDPDHFPAVWPMPSEHNGAQARPRQFIEQNAIRVLHVAGSRASKEPGVAEFVERTLMKTLVGDEAP